MEKARPVISTVFNLALVLLVSQGINWFSPGIAQGDQEETIKIEEAKKEGMVSLYTTVQVTAAEKLFGGFTKKYPFLKTELYRSGSDRLLTKILTEARAKKYIPDVFLSDSQDSYVIRQEGLVRKYVSPEGKVFSAEFKDPDGFWTSSSIITRVLAL